MNRRPSWAVDQPALASDFPIVIGGGPAGLTAAYEFARLGWAPLVLEQAALLGGLLRTESYQGFRFDMGGHRFSTRSEEWPGCGKRCWARTSCVAHGFRASTTAGSSSTTRCARWTPSRGWARSRPCASC